MSAAQQSACRTFDPIQRIQCAALQRNDSAHCCYGMMFPHTFGGKRSYLAVGNSGFRDGSAFIAGRSRTGILPQPQPVRRALFCIPVADGRFPARLAGYPQAVRHKLVLLVLDHPQWV